MKTLSPIVPEPNPSAQLSVVRFPESPGQSPAPRFSPLPTNHPQQDAAPVDLPTPSCGGGEQRSPSISRADGVSQFLDVYDDVIGVADTLDCFIRRYGHSVPEEGRRLSLTGCGT